MRFGKLKLLTRISLVAFGLLVILGLGVRQVVIAQGTNTVVFTGQLIPSYEGAAYDPTIAFQHLSGLPVYVFVYDNWSSTGNDWIVNNRAVRSQVKADGTFQVMGLPHGANYGVYFPYKEVCYTEANYGGTMFDCWDSSQTAVTRGVTRMDGMSAEPVTAPFRAPILENRDGITGTDDDDYGDGIGDVFSYGFIECGADCDVTTAFDQYGDPVSIEERYVFISSTNRLDIQSHINVFPVIPTTSLKVAVRACSAAATVPCELGGNLEVYATRVARRATPWELVKLAQGGTSGYNFSCGPAGYSCDAEAGPGPGTADGIDDSCGLGAADACDASFEVFISTEPTIVRGRTTRINSTEDYNVYFNAFAPPGYYSVTVWRSGQAVTYLTYAANSSLGTSEFFTKFAFVDNSSDSYWQRTDALGTGDFRDGEGVLQIPVLPTVSVVWGRVVRQLPWGPFDAYLPVLQGGPEGGVDVDENVVAADVGITYTSLGAISRTNKFGVFSFFSLESTNPHGLEVGVVDLDPNPPNYLETLDTVFINRTSGPQQVQDFILREEQSRGLYAITALPKGFATEGVNGVAVSVLCTSCPYTRSSRQVTTSRGKASYRDVLTKSEPGFFYFPPGWFEDYESYRVIFSTRSLLAVCDLDDPTLFDPSSANYIGSADLRPLADFCTIPPDANYGSIAGDTVILDSKPSTQVAGLLPNLHVPSAWAQQADIVCSDPADEVVIEGTYGAPSTSYSGWAAEIYRIMYWGGAPTSVSSGGGGVSEIGQQGGIGGFLDAMALYYTSSFFNLTGIDLGGIALGQNLTLGAISVDESNESFTWTIECDALTDFGEGATVKLVALLSEEEGSGRADGVQEVEISPVIEETGGGGAQLVGYSFLPLSPHVIVEPDCPGSTWNKPDTWLPSWICSLVKGVTGMLPGIFNFLETTMLRTEPLTESPAVVEMWNAMRNLANVLTLVLLVVIGFLTIFRLNPREFQPGSALGALLVSLVLINLSLLICEVFIDLNNALVVYLFDVFEAIIKRLAEAGLTESASTGTFYGIAAMGGFLAINLTGVLASAIAMTIGTGGTAGVAILLGALTVVLTIAFALVAIALAFLILYMIRYAVIWLCVIIAPLIFFLSNIPMFGEDVRKSWFKIFIGFTLIQTMAALIIGIGAGLMLGLGGESVGFWQAMRTLLIGIGVLYLGTKSPTGILGMFGLDIGAGRMMGDIGKIAEPVMEKLGEFKQRYATGEGLAQRRTERAAKIQQWQAEGVSGRGLAFRKALSYVPGVGGLQTRMLGAKQEYLKQRDEGYKAGQQVRYLKYKVAPWRGKALATAWGNVAEDEAMVDRQGKAVLEVDGQRLSMGHVRARHASPDNFAVAIGRGEPDKKTEKVKYRQHVINEVEGWIDRLAADLQKSDPSITTRAEAKKKVKLRIIQQFEPQVQTEVQAARWYERKGFNFDYYHKIYKGVRDSATRAGSAWPHGLYRPPKEAPPLPGQATSEKGAEEEGEKGEEEKFPVKRGPSSA